MDTLALRRRFLKEPAMGGERADWQAALRTALDTVEAQVIEITDLENQIVEHHVYDCMSCKFCGNPVDSSAETGGRWMLDSHGPRCPITTIQNKRRD